MKQHGHDRSADECDRKSRHNIITDRRKKSGEGGNPWKHYKLIDFLFEDNPSVTPLSSFFTLTDSTSHVQLRSSTTSTTSSDTPATSSPTTPTPTPTNNETPTVTRLKRKRLYDDEPEFMRRYRAELAEMHKERMALERRKLVALEQLVKLIKENNN